MIHSLDAEKPSLEYDPDLRNLSSTEHNILNTTVYHGVKNASKVLEILDSGSVKSMERVGIDNLDDREKEDEAEFIEDVLRFNDGVPDESLDLIDFAEENQEFLEENGSEGTKRFIKGPIAVYNITGSKLKDRSAYDPMRSFCISVGEEITYHVDSRVSNGGAAFEISVPTDTIINPGIGGNIPGEIPLDYVTSIFYDEEMLGEDVDNIETHESVETHGISVDPVEKYWENSELFDY